MGMIFSRIWDKLGGQKYRILMVGLDAAGKTTILYKLKLGFNVEEVKYKNIEFTVWDVGGQDKLIPMYYFSNSKAVIYVVDSTDTKRFDKARTTLENILRDDELRDAILLVLANKQDLPGAASPDELAEHLGLHAMRGRQWYIQSTCAVTGDGLYEGFDWMASTLKRNRSSSSY